MGALRLPFRLPTSLNPYPFDASATGQDRFLYLLANVGVSFDPTDDDSGSTGFVSQTYPDGAVVDFDRWLYLLANVGVGFNNTDDASGDSGFVSQTYPDGNIWEDFDRYLYLLCNVIAANRKAGWRFTYARVSTKPYPTKPRAPRTW